MDALTIDAIKAHAAAEYPREACGLVIVERGRECYVACRNAATTPSEHFVLDHEDYAAAEDRGEVIGVVHSHPDAPPAPSQADRVACEASGLPWHIVAWPGGEMRSIEPCGYVAPLVGRQFVHGVLDCWSLVRDFYARKLRIELADAFRPDLWWNDGASDLYTQGLAQRGGVVLDPDAELQPGDVIFMQIRSKNGVPNHAAIYLGDTQILHHLYNRLSSRDVYGGYWREVTRFVARHRTLIDNPPPAGFFSL